MVTGRQGAPYLLPAVQEPLQELGNDTAIIVRFARGMKKMCRHGTSKECRRYTLWKFRIAESPLWQRRFGVVWGECANDFRTFLLSQPELPCLELVSG